MPGNADEMSPFDSYNLRLSEALGQASKEKEAVDEKRAETAAQPSPFDSFAGRLGKALEAAPETPAEVVIADYQDEPEPFVLDESRPPEELRDEEQDLAEFANPVQTENTTPENYRRHVVRNGDCLNSIADRYGLFWETIWNDGNNSALKEKRESPDVLMDGDVVFVRDLQRKEEPGETENEHRFRRKGKPTRFSVVVTYRGEPRANEPYRLVIGREEMTGSLDEEGRLEVYVPATARDADLHVGEGIRARTYELQLGALDPINTVVGIKQRLGNMGYETGDESDQMNAETRYALAQFQSQAEIEVTGVADTATRERLEQEHGS